MVAAAGCSRGACFGAGFMTPDPRFVQIVPDGAGPFGDPYQVDSANNGPYGAALTQLVKDKGMQAEARSLAARLGLSDRVRFPGFLDMEAKVREGEAADIFINTSHVDNMPVAVIEAGALGLPVVSTMVGGIADLLTDGGTALLTPDDDVEAMAGAVRRLLGDPDLSARLSANGRQLAERSDWERVRPRWEELFAELLSASERGQHEAIHVRH